MVAIVFSCGLKALLRIEQQDAISEVIEPLKQWFFGSQAGGSMSGTTMSGSAMFGGMMPGGMPPVVSPGSGLPPQPHAGAHLFLY